MKKYVLGLIILAVISLCTIISHQYTKHVYNDADVHVETINDRIDENAYSAAFEEAKILQESFESKNKLLSVYTSHTKLDEISASISRLIAYIENENKNDSLAELNAIRARLEIIYNEEKINLGNIL